MGTFFFMSQTLSSSSSAYQSLSRIADPADQPWEVRSDGLPALDASQLTPERLRQLFRHPRPWTPELADESRRPLPGREIPVPAAVLVPLVVRECGLQVMLTQRSAHLHDHAGQICFPGGRADPGDTTLIETALRETEEETGVDRSHIEVLGTLPEYLTATGYRVTPVVGLTAPGFRVMHDPFEVAEVFEVPLEFLMNPQNHRLHTAALKDGVVRRYYSMPFGHRFIWGATAGMLRNLYHLLRA